jgi:arylsulfatase A-like enzyme
MRLKNSIFLLLAVCAALHQTTPTAKAAGERPNIVYILCDDLGYGDVHALNPDRCKIETPHLDRVAESGMAFTDSHSNSSVCTPTRYGVLTGRYAWRTRLQSGVLWGFDEPLIAPERLTVAELLRRQGYQTAAIGKWHLGLRFGANRWTDRIEDGPLQHGFDFYFGISASLDMPPFAYIENDRFPQEPTATKTWVRSGPAAPDFEAVDVLPELAKRAAGYIDAKATDSKQGKPFFLYLALTSPHTPLVPSAEWQGKSRLGAYGDFVMETDWAVGRVLTALEAAGVADNTLLIVTSDNGCAPYIGAAALEAQGHYPSGDFRGYKADIWDGGHRVPFLARWPAKTPAGSRSSRLVSLTDLLATCAELVGQQLPASAGEDSVSFLPALLGQNKAPPRTAIVHHSISGKFAIREGDWKLELCPGSGGWAAPLDTAARKLGLPETQLYNLAEDPGEQHNVAAENATIVERLGKLLDRFVADGRSTPGEAQANDAAIEVRKLP